MSATTQLLRRLILFLLILNCLYPVLVFGQDETTPAPDPPEPTTREAPQPTTREPPPDPTTREPPPSPTTREPAPTTQEPEPTASQDPPTSRPEPTSRAEPTESLTDPPIPSISTTIPTSTILTTTTQTSDTNTVSTFTSTVSTGTSTTSISVTSSIIIGSNCQQECLARTAGTLGCVDMNDRTCICRQLESYINAANTCMQNICDPSQSAQAIDWIRRMCQGPAPPGTSTTSPGPNTTPRNPPSPGSTVGTQGGTGVNGQLTTQTQTLVLTAGQVVTLPVSGTVRTTFTASSALTTTRIATMLEQAGFGGNGGDGASGSGAMGLHVGFGMSFAVAVVGVMVGAVFVL